MINMVLLRPNISKRSSYDQANWPSRLFFYWLLDFVLEFRKKEVRISNLEQCPEYERSEKIGQKLEIKWKKELQKTKAGMKPSLGRALIKTVGWHYSLCFVPLLISSMLGVLQSLCVGSLIQSLYAYNSGENSSHVLQRETFLSATGIVFTQFLHVYIHNMYWFLARTGGIAARVACSHLIYRKSIRLSQSSLGKTTVGQIVNFLSNDVSRFDPASAYLFFFIQGPIEVMVCIIILWPMLGISIIIGLLALSLNIPFQAFIGKMFGKIRAKGATLTDERISLLNEFIPAMRVIKMYAWEKPLQLLIDRARKREVNQNRLAAYLSALNFGIAIVSEKLVMFVTLVSFVLLGNQLTAGTVFVTITIIRQLQRSLTVYIPWAIQFGAGSLISIERIRDFLLLPEYKPSRLGQTLDAGSERPKVTSKNVTIAWNDDGPCLLENISFDVLAGQLMVILGPVGSGKTSLLLSILGEINTKAGRLEVFGSVSYACQQGWVFAGTVRDNILFGNPFNVSRYQRVISVTALDRDLRILPAGDQTFVGERGSSLSGGQRARINLARALYAQANIYLLDDPFSAVDAPVAKHIFENSIKDFLSDKIVILVTHQIQFIKFADLILQLPLGKLSLQSGSGPLTCIPDICCTELKDESSRAEYKPFDNKENDEIGEFRGIKLNKRLVQTYFCAGIGVSLLPLWSIYVHGAESLIVFTDYYFALWADSSERKCEVQFHHAKKLENTTSIGGNFVDHLSVTENIMLLSGLTLALLFWCCTRNFAFLEVCIRSSIELHNRMIRSILHAPISFFDKYPPGIVLNRISRDMGVVDDALPLAFLYTVIIFGGNIAALILMTVISPYFVASAMFLFFSCLYLRNNFVNITRDVKRLEGVTKSPVFSHISSTLYGLTTIRAFRVQERFEEAFDFYQDEHTSAYFTWLASGRYLILLTNTMSLIFTAMVVITCLFVIDSLNISLVGLVITSAIGISMHIQFGMKYNYYEPFDVCYVKVLRFRFAFVIIANILILSLNRNVKNKY